MKHRVFIKLTKLTNAAFFSMAKFSAAGNLPFTPYTKPY